MTPQEEEVVKELNEKIANYESILEETLAEEKSMTKVLAGPFEFDGKKFYRTGSTDKSLMMFVWETSPYGTDITTDIPKDTEVIVVKQAIISLVPEELEIKKADLSFDLIDWNEIGGLKSQIADIRNAVELPINNAALAEEFGVECTNGILLWGPPGCAKTLIAKAIASTILKSAKADPESFIYLKGASLLSKWVGETEQNISKIFKNAREYYKKTGTKAVLFIDEAEALLNTRGSRKSSDVDMTIVPTFLSEMSGLEGDNPIVILATNLPDNLDPAVIRPGRIDLKIEIKRPNNKDAIEIFEIHLSKMLTHDKVPDLSAHGAKFLYSFMTLLPHVSGAMIETISKTAGSKAMTRFMTGKKEKKGILKKDLEESINAISLSYAKTTV